MAYLKTHSALIYLSLFALIVCIGCGKSSSINDYGVFLGLNGDEISRLRDYQMVVIEPSEFHQEQVQTLHREGKTVYAYLNIGALENYRPYHDQFSHLVLGDYEGWPDEQWIDVSSYEWQDFVSEMGSECQRSGYDGLFLDNADVYYFYPSESIYSGLCSILERLKALDMAVMINGGDTFVSRCIEDGHVFLIDSINQESVFTDITSPSGRQSEETTTYYKEYLSRASNSGLEVFLTEYKAGAALSKQIDEFCRQNGFHWYNAAGLDLR